MRDEFHYFPSLNVAQFLSPQFVERRLVLTAEILELVVKRRKELQWLRKQQDAVWAPPKGQVPWFTCYLCDHPLGD